MRSAGLVPIFILAVSSTLPASAHPPTSPTSDAIAQRGQLQKACTAGDRVGCRHLALSLLVGDGGNRDPQTALKMWFEECLASDYEACQNLGWAYDQGIGVPRNQTIGAGYERLACERAPHDGACTDYYRAVLLGEGVARDEKLALEKLGEQCREGAFAACANAALADELGLAGHKIDRARAEAAYKTACDAGRSNGCERLGRMLLASKPADTAAAAAAFRSACSHYNADACAELAPLVSPAEAATLRQRACTLGVTTACAAR